MLCACFSLVSLDLHHQYIGQWARPSHRTTPEAEAVLHRYLRVWLSPGIASSAAICKIQRPKPRRIEDVPARAAARAAMRDGLLATRSHRRQRSSNDGRL